MNAAIFALCLSSVPELACGTPGLTGPVVPTSQAEWESAFRPYFTHDRGSFEYEVQQTSIALSYLCLEKGRWPRDILLQPAFTKVLNDCADLRPHLEALTRNPDYPALGMQGMAHYRRLTWEECREHHARTLAEMRRVRGELENPGYANDSARSGVSPRALRKPGDSLWLQFGPSLLARFPTPAAVEELAVTLESAPDYAEHAANALSVCVTGSSAPRVAAALRTAEETLVWREKTTGQKPGRDHDFTRLKAKLANLSADLTDMPEVMGVRFVIPDPGAAAVNDLPVPAPSPATTTVAVVTTPGAGGRGWSWWWLLLLLVPVTAWAALGRNAR